MAAAERRGVRQLVRGLVVPAALLCACGGPGEFRRLEVRDQTTPGSPFMGPRPPAVDLGATALRLVDGIAVQARVSAIDDSNEAMPVIELRSDDPEVFGVTRAPNLGRFIFFGASPGSAQLVVLSDGREVATLSVTVDPQPAR